MPRNKVQFQQALSLQEFLSQYDSEENCCQSIVQCRWPRPNGFKYSECAHDQYCTLNSRRLFQCNKCRSLISIPARTIFDSSKPSLTTWFPALYYIIQSKTIISALSLKKTIGISYNKALLMKHKVQQIMKERDDSKPIASHLIQLDHT